MSFLGTVRYVLDKSGLVKDNSGVAASQRIIIQNKRLSDVIKGFIDSMKKSGVKNVNISSVCNSIGTGYTVSSEIIPTFRRVDSSLFEGSGLNIKYYSWARGQDNCDEHLFEWFINDTTQTEINELVTFDFTGAKPKAMSHKTITESDVLNYYPTVIPDDIGLQSLVAENGDELANIIVYNGDTASFLDNFTRGGAHKNLYGFYRDLESMENFLFTVKTLYPDTQIYICGIPHIFHLRKLTDFAVNKNIMEMCLKYPNCVYVDSAMQKGRYFSDGKFVVDIHYNQEEYLDLLSNVYSAIGNNYVPVKALCELDAVLNSSGFLDTPKFQEELEAKFDECVSTLFSKYRLSENQLTRMRECFLKRYSNAADLNLSNNSFGIKSSDLKLESSNLSEINDSFISIMNSFGVQEVNLTGVGDLISPLFLGNTDLNSKVQGHIKYYNFSDSKNGKNHIYEWFLKNRTQSDISGFKVDDDKGLQDLVGMHYDGLANIIVYNGYSDYVELNGFLQYTYLKYPHTQIYVCGVSGCDNEKVKKACSKYSNCVFVETLSKDDFYLSREEKVDSDNQAYYLYLIENIMKSIVENYSLLAALTDFDLSMKRISKISEVDEPANIGFSSFDSYWYIMDFFSKYNLSPSQLKKVELYFKERKPHDFFHVDSRIIKWMLNNPDSIKKMLEERGRGKK